MRLAEVVASLSLTTDLAGGLPLEHGPRRNLLAVWLGEDLGLSADELSDVYYVALLARQPDAVTIMSAAGGSRCRCSWTAMTSLE